MHSANVNEKWTFQVSSKDGSMELDGKPVDWDALKLEDGVFHILSEGKSYRAEVLNYQADSKTVSLRINGEKFTVSIKDEYDQLLKKMGIEMGAGNHQNEIKAPMPGLVLDILVIDGQELAKGDPVLILEAMKMENVLKSPGACRVKNIHTSKGEAVKKNQTLVSLN